MAEEEHLKILKQGTVAWNAWRQENPGTRPELGVAELLGADLEGFNLDKANLSGAYLMGANLEGASLEGARLIGTHLINVDLGRAKLIGAHLLGTNLVESDLGGANFKGANLEGANLGMTNLEGANLGRAKLIETILNNVDLSVTKDLNDCQHLGPSCVDYRTIARSKEVPISFWRGCGLPDALIDYMPSLTGEAVQFYSCFISYSSKDQEFADRLHADLQNAGVRCWFAPHDLPIGSDILETIDAQIRVRDKVILILSEASVASAWVTHEANAALKEEEAGRRILFPIRIDDAVMDTTDQWAHDIRRRRNIGDFTRWKDYDAYKATFERVLRDLKAEP